MKIKESPRIVLAGSVNSSLVTLQKMVEHECQLAGVFGLHPDGSKNVSGYQDLVIEALKHNIQAHYFEKINDESVVEQIKKLKPDLLFVIGLSQMIRKPLLDVATIGNVGFHPTLLPRGRGRGAIAWIVLGKAEPAATFFLMDEGMDSGPILGQTAVPVRDDWFAQDVIDEIKIAIGFTLEELLPSLNNGTLEPKVQDESKATYLGQRKPKDGLIDWTRPAEKIDRLIRATSRPLPGAFSYFSGAKVVIWKSSVNERFIGVPGRIVWNEDFKPVVACGDSSLTLEEFEFPAGLDFKVGKEFENLGN